MKIIKSASLDAIDAICIDVESTFTRGLPTFTIVGMISTSISESKDRVKSALLTNGFKFPPLKITFNLPSAAPKQVAGVVVYVPLTTIGSGFVKVTVLAPSTALSVTVACVCEYPQKLIKNNSSRSKFFFMIGFNRGLFFNTVIKIYYFYYIYTF